MEISDNFISQKFTRQISEGPILNDNFSNQKTIRTPKMMTKAHIVKDHFINDETPIYTES